ncbi:MAG: glycosyltransferase, partial [Bryobacteraceae bacterium]
MTVWIVCPGEPLPIDDDGQRMLRAGILSMELVRRGHEVVWWTSSFDHSSKRHRTPHSAMAVTREGIRLQLLRGMTYSRNIGIPRLVNHFQMAREFERLCRTEPAPDVMFCCWPTIELGHAAVRYANERSIPIALDVRDLWPDLYLDAVPAWLRKPAKVLLTPYFRATQFAFGHASAIVGISERYLQWGLSYAGRQCRALDAVFPLGYSAPDLTNAHSPEDREKFRSLGVDESRLLCWFLGSFGNTYDLEPVIRAARKLKEEGVTDCQ